MKIGTYGLILLAVGAFGLAGCEQRADPPPPAPATTPGGAPAPATTPTPDPLPPAGG